MLLGGPIQFIQQVKDLRVVVPAVVPVGHGGLNGVAEEPAVEGPGRVAHVGAEVVDGHVKGTAGQLVPVPAEVREVWLEVDPHRLSARRHDPDGLHPVRPPEGHHDLQFNLGAVGGLAPAVPVHILVAGLVQNPLGLVGVVGEAQFVHHRLIHVLLPDGQEAGGVGLLDDVAVDLGHDFVHVDDIGHRPTEGRVVHRLLGGVHEQEGGVGGEHIWRIVVPGLHAVAALHQGGDARQEVVAQVHLTLEEQAEGHVIAGVDDVHNVLGCHRAAQQFRGPPVVVPLPDHAVLGVGLVDVGAGAHRGQVRAVDDLLLRPPLPGVLGDDGDRVQQVPPLLVADFLKGEADRIVVYRLHLLHPPRLGIPEAGIVDARQFAQFKGVDDIGSGEGLAVLPLDALAEFHLVDLVAHKLAALRQPGDVLVLQGVKEEEGLVAEADHPHGVGAQLERVPRGRRTPLLPAGVEGLVARIDHRRGRGGRSDDDGDGLLDRDRLDHGHRLRRTGRQQEAPHNEGAQKHEHQFPGHLSPPVFGNSG